jgi:PIN domain nuclease of toxin-antitoxin system
MLLLDTHAVVWWVDNPKRIPREATRAIDKALRKSETIGVSSFSLREIALLARAGRLRLGMDLDVWLGKVEALRALAFYPVNNRIARRSASLLLETKDPADRIIVSTALEYGATLITGDERIRAYEGVRSIWD